VRQAVSSEAALTALKARHHEQQQRQLEVMEALTAAGSAASAAKDRDIAALKAEQVRCTIRRVLALRRRYVRRHLSPCSEQLLSLDFR
jgi:hypothetical protein